MAQCIFKGSNARVGGFGWKKIFAHVHVLMYLGCKIQPVMLIPALLGQPGAA